MALHTARSLAHTHKQQTSREHDIPQPHTLLVPCPVPRGDPWMKVRRSLRANCPYNPPCYGRYEQRELRTCPRRGDNIQQQQQQQRGHPGFRGDIAKRQELGKRRKRVHGACTHVRGRVMCGRVQLPSRAGKKKFSNAGHPIGSNVPAPRLVGYWQSLTGLSIPCVHGYMYLLRWPENTGPAASRHRMGSTYNLRRYKAWQQGKAVSISVCNFGFDQISSADWRLLDFLFRVLWGWCWVQ